MMFGIQVTLLALVELFRQAGMRAYDMVKGQ